MLRRLIVPFALCLFLASVAKADPIVITGGFLISGGIAQTNVRWNFNGPNFSFAGSTGTNAGWDALNNIVSAGLHPFRVNYDHSALGLRNTGPTSQFTLNGVSYWYFGSNSFEFRGNILIPSLPVGFHIVEAPFLLTGDMRGVQVVGGDPSNPVVFSVTGQGTLRLLINAFVGPLGDVRYAQSSGADAIQFFFAPEPSSIVLLATGLAAVAGFRRKIAARIRTFQKR